MTIGEREEIEELPQKLTQEIFFVDGKFKPALMGGHIVYHAFYITDLDCQVTRGFLVTKDNKRNMAIQWVILGK